MSFEADVNEYLKNLTDKSARVFGIRYCSYLQRKYYRAKPNPRPAPICPQHRLVQLEIRRIFEARYGIEAEAVERQHAA